MSSTSIRVAQPAEITPLATAAKIGSRTMAQWQVFLRSYCHRKDVVVIPADAQGWAQCDLDVLEFEQGHGLRRTAVLSRLLFLFGIFPSQIPHVVMCGATNPTWQSYLCHKWFIGLFQWVLFFHVSHCECAKKKKLQHVPEEPSSLGVCM